jgi:hypothetical protein
MQLTEKKLKEMIKEAVKEALDDKETLKVFISECLKYTISGLYEEINTSKKGANVESDEGPSFTPPARKSFQPRNENKINKKDDKVFISENSYIKSNDLDSARKMFESEFSPAKTKSNRFEENEESGDDEIMKLIGAK